MPINTNHRAVNCSTHLTLKGYIYDEQISLSELKARFDAGEAKKDSSTFATIWNMIKEFFNGTDKEKVCGAFCDIFNNNDIDNIDKKNEVRRAQAILEFMSYLTTESKQQLVWQAFDDELPTFLVSMQLPDCIFHSPLMKFSALAEACNNSPKNLPLFLELIKNITDESLFNKIMDHYVERVISSETKPAGSDDTWINMINIMKGICILIDVLKLFTSTENTDYPFDESFPIEPEKINDPLLKVFTDIIANSEHPWLARKYIKKNY